MTRRFTVPDTQPEDSTGDAPTPRQVPGCRQLPRDAPEVPFYVPDDGEPVDIRDAATLDDELRFLVSAGC